MQKNLTFINIVPVFPGNEAFTISEIRRQYRETGLRQFAMCLSYHPQRTPAQLLIPELCRTFAAIRDGVRDLADLELGVLIQSTQGHGWNGRIPLTDEKWQHIIEQGGKESPRWCFLDPDFRGYILEAISETVKAGAAFLLVDDDFGLRHKECFCPLHIAEFNRAAGTNYTREDLDKVACRQWNDPEYMLFAQQRFDQAVAWAKEIRKAIDSVNPEIRCAICTPYAGYGFVGAVAEALAGKTEPLIRINNAIYGMQNPLDYYWTVQGTLMVRHQAPRVKDFIDESDTFPQNYYSESATSFHGHITHAMLNGLCGCKLWTSEFETPVDHSSQKRYENKLAEYYNFYRELAGTVEGIDWKGITSPVFRPPFANHHTLCAGALTPAEWNRCSLGPYAFPIHYGESGKTDRVYALTGGVANMLSDDEIKTLLAGKLLLDSSAAVALTKRGFAQYMGVTASCDNEKFAFTKEFEPAANTHLPFMWEDGLAELKVIDGKTEVLTQLGTGAARGTAFALVAPGSTIFKNELGGTVAVTVFRPDLPYYKTMRPQRRRWLKMILEKVNGGTLEMSVENADQQMIVRHGICPDGSELVAIQNLNIDPTAELQLSLAQREPKEVKRLTAGGTWEAIPFSVDGEKSLLTLPVQLHCAEFAIIKMVF